jgi:formamidopyrimidine-DNA glycosylase
MPELPEVETVRRQLQDFVIGKEIRTLAVFENTIIKGDLMVLEKILTANRIIRMDRIGKLLQFHLSTGHILLAHLKMTGQFLYQEAGKTKAGIYPLLYASVPGGKKTAGTFQENQGRSADKHTHLVITFHDGSTLSYRDIRKFGYLMLIYAAELKTVEERYGIDPLRENFTREAFHQVFVRKQKSLKTVLMDQSLIAGIGNIYADEICHQTRLRPDTSVKNLSPKDLDALYYASADVIQKAVKNKGTTLRDYLSPDGQEGNNAFELKAYGRDGLECLQCGHGKIVKITHRGRGTHYCDTCQQ